MSENLEKKLYVLNLSYKETTHLLKKIVSKHTWQGVVAFAVKEMSMVFNNNIEAHKEKFKGEERNENPIANEINLIQLDWILSVMNAFQGVGVGEDLDMYINLYAKMSDVRMMMEQEKQIADKLAADEAAKLKAEESPEDITVTDSDSEDEIPTEFQDVNEEES